MDSVLARAEEFHQNSDLAGTDKNASIYPIKWPESRRDRRLREKEGCGGKANLSAIQKLISLVADPVDDFIFELNYKTLLATEFAQQHIVGIETIFRFLNYL